MGWWVLAVVLLVALGCVPTVLLGGSARRAAAAVLRAALRVGRRTPPDPPPPRRPFEVIAREARRLGPQFRATREGVSFAKSEGVRRAYDGVLAESCEALDLPHLLTVLHPGPELDAERHRVERLLHIWGLRLDDAA